MAPLRRARAAAATRWAPYKEGGSLLSRCRRARRGLDGGDDDEQPLEHGVVTTSALLHDDALAAVFSRLHDDGPAVVRCAVTCRRWARVVSREAAALARALPPLGSLALGFFHRDDDMTGRRRSGAFFIPTTSGSRLLGSTASSLLDGVRGVDSDCSRPVASRNGRLVLELRREGRADGLRLCVCDPITGAADVLPPLSGQDRPGYYVCALLTGEDADPPVFSPAYFRLLLVYNRRGFTALRWYSSDTGSWGPEDKAGTRISTGWLQCNMVQATALRGAVYWPLDRFVLGVRLDGSTSSSMDQFIVPSYASPGKIPLSRSGSGNGAIGVSPDRRLCSVGLILCGDILGVETLSFFRDDAGNDGDVSAGRWVRQDMTLFTQFKVKCAAAMTRRWYCEKSGVFFFTLAQGSSIRGTLFAFHLETKTLEKVADRDAWTNFCGYEMQQEVYMNSLVVPP